MNFRAIRTIYFYEMLRAWNTLFQSLASPVITTILYFVVFGSAIGSRIDTIEGVLYGLFIVPGLTMLSVLTLSSANASFGIFFRNSREVSTRFYQHRSRIWKFLLAMWVRQILNY